MKVLSSCVLALALMACSHGGSNAPDLPQPNPTPAPAPGPVSYSSQVSVFVVPTGTIPNSAYTVRLNGTHDLALRDNYFSSDSLTMPQLSWLTLYPSSPDYFEVSRLMPLASGARTFADMVMVEKRTDLVNGSSAGQWSLPNGGTISYGPNSFNPAAPYVYSNWVEPTTALAALRIPAFTIYNGTELRYLRSYGCLYVEHGGLLPGKTMTATWPIPPAQLPQAPDSIATWKLSATGWVRKGLAIRSGSNYTAARLDEGVWNFAAETACAQVMLKVKTDAGQPVQAAAVRIVNSIGMEVAAARTNIDGEALCLLPAGENVEVQLVDHWQPGQQVLFRQSLPAVGTGTRSISLPVSQWYLYTVQGSASDCGGVPITRGYVRLREGINGFQPFFPVSNGSFAGAYVMTYGSLMDARFEVRNQNSSELAGDTSMLLRAAQNNSLQLKSCVPRTGLWARYTVDGTPYSYTSDLASPTAVNFTGWPGGGGTTISADGFQFSITASGIGTYTGAGVSLIWVNNQYVVLESSQPYRFTFTRFDAFAGMFIEGSYDFYYHDNTLAVHHIVGDFRVRRG